MFNPIIAALPDNVPFVAPEELERDRGAPFIARLGANESAFGISLKAEEALRAALDTSACSWYGDPLSHDLRTALSSQLEVSMDNLCVDAGIDSLLGLTVRLFLQPGDTLVTSGGAYPTVNYHALGAGGVVKAVPYNNHHEDTIALAEAAHQTSARLVYLANPDNPMGTQVSQEAIEMLISQLPHNCTLLLDEAYIEFMPAQSSLPIRVGDANVVRFRTFSKAYGMAGMRIGYAIANERIIRGYDKIRNHFGVNRLAQIAAVASLQDDLILTRVINAVQHGRERVYALARSLELAYIPSATNFVAVDFGTQERATTVLKQLAECGVFLRKPMQPPQDQFIRIGVGTEAEHNSLSEALSALICR